MFSCPKLLTFIPLLSKLHSFCKTHWKFCRSNSADEKKKQGSNLMTFLSLLILKDDTSYVIEGSVHLPCLFLSPQPLPLSPSCTRSVPPWGASPCHGHSRSNPMASSWTMRSGTMRRWACSAFGFARPKASHCFMGGGQLRAQKETSWRQSRERK